MIGWLTSWLREIILILLIATFAELLLPNQKMQRYVKVVFSLFILMTLLSPVIRILKDDPFEQLSAELDRGKAQTVLGRQTAPPLPSESEIHKESERVNAFNERQTIKLVESRLSAVMKEGIESETDVKEASVQVKVQLDEKNSPTIHEIEVVLIDMKESSKQAASETPADESPNLVEEVQPVSIQVRVDEAESGSKASGSGQVAANPLSDEEQGRIIEQVTAYLNKEYAVEPSQLRVSFAPELSQESQ